MAENNKEYNVIFLVRKNFDSNNPPSNNDMLFGYNDLIKSLLENENEKYNILLLQYEYADNKRNFTLSIIQNKSITPVYGFGNIVYTNGEVLGLCFNILKRMYPSKKTILFTWEHASPYTLYALPKLENTEKTADININPNALNISYSEHNMIDKKEYINIIHKAINKPYFENSIIDKTEMLTFKEINRALKIGFMNGEKENNKISLLVMINCFVFKLENLYELKDSVQTIVGSATEMAWDGYDYYAFFKDLKSNLSVHDISNNLVEKYYDKFENSQFPEYYRYQIISRVDNIELFANQLVFLLNQLVFELVKDTDTVLQFFKKIEKEKNKEKEIQYKKEFSLLSWLDLTNYAHYYFYSNKLNNQEVIDKDYMYNYSSYDLGIMTSIIRDNTTKGNVRNFAKKILNFLNNNLKRTTSNCTPIVNEAKGIGIFTPVTLDYLKYKASHLIFNNYQSDELLEFHKKCFWLDFIQKAISSSLLQGKQA